MLILFLILEISYEEMSCRAQQYTTLWSPEQYILGVPSMLAA